MKIDFFTLNPDDNVGSYRIWVKDLSKSLSELGHRVRILMGDSQEEDISADVVILGKSAYSYAPDIKKKFKNSKIGAINIPKDHIDKNIDFVIVGSPEELCSMSTYDNVFIYPLIERQFENIKTKNHVNTEKLRICFHGHHPHIAKFAPFLNKAIENVSKEIELELVIITGLPSSTLAQAINAGAVPPLIFKSDVTIEIHQYNISTISDTIMSCDIGIVPNVSDISTYAPPAVANFINPNVGLYETDYSVRFKNKTNGGRAYVFYQHGIPVIHDISPSSFEFMSKTERYIVAHDELSWEKQIRKLYNSDLRNIIAIENYNTFVKHYNPHDHAKKMVKFLENINE